MTKEEKALYDKKYHQAHKQEKAEYQREYRQTHKEEITVSQKEYYQTHKKERAEYDKKYRQAHRTEASEYQKKYTQTKAGKNIHRKGKHKRRALKMGVEYEVFNSNEIFERDGYICQNCGCKTRPDFKNPYHPLYPNLDHIIPLSQGGSHTRLNTQCLCRQCNIVKHNTGTGDQLRMF